MRKVIRIFFGDFCVILKIILSGFSLELVNNQQLNKIN